jgi:diaminopimelate decarboxylase
MDHFDYRPVAATDLTHELHVEGVAISTVAARFGTPTYVYSAATLREHYDRLVAAFRPLSPLVCYSIKSSGNLAILRLLAERGAGMDVVSGGELHRAIAAGVAASRCVYAGVGKTDAEIVAAIDAGIGLLNIESEAEFEVVADLAARRGRTVRAALRVNPDVDPKTHRHTTTGKKETKFGVDLDRARAFFRRYGRDEWCRLEGIHLHIGSPIYSPQPYVESVTKTLRLVDDLASDGFTVRTLDLGGGFGADYETGQTPPLSEYAAALVPLLEARVRRGLAIILEPGRTIVANAGVLVTRVLYRKDGGEKSFVICDAGMNTLLRPSHYEAFHFIWPARVDAARVPARRGREPGVAGLRPVDVVGPICETGDFLALDRPLPETSRGDLLAVFTAGAYGMSMASRYNATPLPAEVLVDGGEARLVRRRESHDDLVAHELEPETSPRW